MLVAQQYWQEKVHATIQRGWLSEGSERDVSRKALLTPFGGAWLHSLPCASRNTVIEHQDYKLALQWQLGLTILPPEAQGN